MWTKWQSSPAVSDNGGGNLKGKPPVRRRPVIAWESLLDLKPQYLPALLSLTFPDPYGLF
ncbi:MAG: hypothetical protein AB1652_04415 [Bacillota bacterium]